MAEWLKISLKCFGTIIGILVIFGGIAGVAFSIAAVASRNLKAGVALLIAFIMIASIFVGVMSSIHKALPTYTLSEIAEEGYYTVYDEDGDAVGRVEVGQ